MVGQTSLLALTDMAKKVNKKLLVKKMDTIFSKAVRSKGSCERCGGNSYLQCAHIYSRRFLATRWEFDNALCLCAGCHRWGHDKPLDFAVFATKVKGEDSIERIRFLAHGLTYKFDHESKYKELMEISKNE